MLGHGVFHTSKETNTVYLQNETRPFTLRYRSQTVEVDYFGEEEQVYLGQIGKPFARPSMSMSIHRMTLKFRFQQWLESGTVYSFIGDCKKAKSFKPKI